MWSIGDTKEAADEVGELVRGKGEGEAVRSAKTLAQFAQEAKALLAAAMEFFGRQGGMGRWGRLGDRGGTEGDPADGEVFLEAVGLKEVGEFEGADVAATGPDLALEIGDEMTQIVEGVTGAQEFEPHALALVTEAELLAGEGAVEVVSLADGGRIGQAGRGHVRRPDRDRWWRWKRMRGAGVRARRGPRRGPCGRERGTVWSRLYGDS